MELMAIMNKQEKHDLGLITVLLDRYQNQRLPAALALLSKVDNGETLNELDLMFVKEVSKDICSNSTLLERHPDCKEIAGSMMSLCCEITKKGLANEK